jgi:hypothetical protein
MGAPAGKKAAGKKVVSKFVLDCTEPVNDNVLDAASFVSGKARRGEAAEARGGPARGGGGGPARGGGAAGAAGAHARACARELRRSVGGGFGLSRGTRE